MLIDEQEPGPAGELRVATSADPTVHWSAPAASALERNTSETLVHVDCLGRPYSGLAQSWSHGGEARRWIFVLRQGAQYADGTPLHPDHVVQSWSPPSVDEVGPWSGLGTVTFGVLDERRVVVILDRPRPDLPQVLADPRLGVRGPGGRPAPGSGYWRDSSADPVESETQRNAPTLRVETVEDPRDAMDAGFEVVLTRNPAVVTYARGTDRYRVVPLPWDRTYVLVRPSGPSVPLDDGAGPSPSLPLPVLESLARDAVRGGARPATGVGWWGEAADCAPGRTTRVLQPVSEENVDQVAYPSEDPIARDLAERLVALATEPTHPLRELMYGPLARSPSGTGLRALGVRHSELEEALTTGGFRAYVIALPVRPVNTCGAKVSLRAALPWVEPGNVIPLVDSRAHAIVRAGSVGLAADGDGSVVFFRSPPAGMR